MTQAAQEPTVWLSLAEASEYLRVSPGFLRQRVRTGSIPYARAGVLLRFRRDRLDIWLDANSKSNSGESNARSEQRSTHRAPLFLCLTLCSTRALERSRKQKNK
jgi:excisionase family DNA binding protein